MAAPRPPFFLKVISVINQAERGCVQEIMCTVARTNMHTPLFLFGFLSVPGRGEELQ